MGDYAKGKDGSIASTAMSAHSQERTSRFHRLPQHFVVRIDIPLRVSEVLYVKRQTASLSMNGDKAVPRISLTFPRLKGLWRAAKGWCL